MAGVAGSSSPMSGWSDRAAAGCWQEAAQETCFREAYSFAADLRPLLHGGIKITIAGAGYLEWMRRRWAFEPSFNTGIATVRAGVEAKRLLRRSLSKMTSIV